MVQFQSYKENRVDKKMKIISLILVSLYFIGIETSNGQKTVPGLGDTVLFSVVDSKSVFDADCKGSLIVNGVPIDETKVSLRRGYKSLYLISLRNKCSL